MLIDTRVNQMETVALLERLHRAWLEIVKRHLDRNNLRDLNNVQAMIIHSIGDEELTVGELTHRGYYLGSNVSYNVKKLTTNGYLEQRPGLHDKRSVQVKLTPKAIAVRQLIEKLSDQYAQRVGEPLAKELSDANRALRQLERIWTRD
ncbi:MAG TPA: winged helix DNA-binding protein [Dongiaceae bacterium]|jgi:DNA-binding MarR family transcriptional regulator|nr:winged helix DNA-binding protein [Dongiaceae bacterium]